MKLFPSLALSQKAIAGIVVGVIGVGAAVGTFASQDVLFQSGDDEFAALESTETPEATETAEATETPEATETAEATETPEPTAEPTETPEATPESQEADDDEDGDDHSPREIKGIPDEDNPACDKHGCEVVQTPGCVEVRVPSVAASHERGKEGHGKDCDSDNDDSDDEDEED